MSQGVIDPVELARRLIACRSVTPEDGGAQDLLAGLLEGLGMEVVRIDRGATRNLFARIGSGRPHVGFCGHTDVVPAGGSGWTSDAFEPEVRDGVLYGRGACDMKGAVACFVAALGGVLEKGRPAGTVSLMITGDEEGPATDGTIRIVEWLRGRPEAERPDFVLVGEPTNPEAVGDAIRIGRRGSMNVAIEIRGMQGHAAYPDRADNPVHRMLRALHALTARVLDDGTEWFQPSGLQVTSVDVGNPTSNVIPGKASARLNLRFNDRQDSASLEAWIRGTVAEHATNATVTVEVGAEAFLVPPSTGSEALVRVVERRTGRRPRLDTVGGTSDARFIAPLCAVAEFGLVGATMHQVDERVPVADLHTLAAIYRDWLMEMLPVTDGGDA